MSWLRASLNRNKGYAEAYILLAETLLASGRLDAAVIELEAGVKAVPTDAGLQLGLGKAYFKAGRFVGRAREARGSPQARPGGAGRSRRRGAARGAAEVG